MLLSCRTCEEVGTCDVTAVALWLSTIPFEDWPQQTRLEDGNIRPAMVTDPDWYGFHVVTDHLVNRWGETYNRILSVVMPGHSIPEHVDRQPENWTGRIHIPIFTNDRAIFIADGEPFHMQAGKAYFVNTLAKHEIRNDGDTPRIHLMFDVKEN